MNASGRARTQQHGRSATVSPRVAQRTCVGCQRVHPKEQLMRLVCGPTGQILVDVHGKLPGRGVHLCAQRPCVEQALKRTRLQEAFRREVTLVPSDELAHAMASVMEERGLGYIRIARKAGRVVSGYTQVSRALRYGPVACLLVAEDTALERRREYQGWCATHQIPCRLFLTKVRLGELAGRDESSAVGILDPRLGERLIGAIEGMSRLSER